MTRAESSASNARQKHRSRDGLGFSRESRARCRRTSDTPSSHGRTGDSAICLVRGIGRMRASDTRCVPRLQPRRTPGNSVRLHRHTTSSRRVRSSLKSRRSDTESPSCEWTRSWVTNRTVIDLSPHPPLPFALLPLSQSLSGLAEFVEGEIRCYGEGVDDDPAPSPAQVVTDPLSVPCPRCKDHQAHEIYRQFARRVMFCPHCEHSWDEDWRLPHT